MNFAQQQWRRQTLTTTKKTRTMDFFCQVPRLLFCVCFWLKWAAKRAEICKSTQSTPHLETVKRCCFFVYIQNGIEWDTRKKNIQQKRNMRKLVWKRNKTNNWKHGFCLRMGWELKNFLDCFRTAFCSIVRLNEYEPRRTGNDKWTAAKSKQNNMFRSKRNQRKTFQFIVSACKNGISVSVAQTESFRTWTQHNNSNRLFSRLIARWAIQFSFLFGRLDESINVYFPLCAARRNVHTCCERTSHKCYKKSVFFFSNHLHMIGIDTWREKNRFPDQ